MFYATIGSISTGTLLPKDLADTFHSELTRLAQRDDAADRKAYTLAALAKVQPVLQLEADDDKTLEVLEAFVSEVAPDLFNAYCPPYTFFGCHPGDGADFGVWPDIESANVAAQYEDGMVKVNAGDAWPELDDDIDHVLEVNDHGNVSLFCARTRTELWSCV